MVGYTNIILLVLVLVFLTVSAKRENRLFPGEKWESDVIDLGNGGDDIFYIYFEAREPRPGKERPLVVWFTGGPGCSSTHGLFLEMGPYKFNYTKSPQGTYDYFRNPHSWNNFADLLFVDQPVGTGFSRAKEQHQCTGQLCVSHNFYSFIKKFLVRHPELRRHPVYLTGESYAGKFVPAIAAYLLRIADPDIKVQGCLIGGGMINRFIQRSLDPLYFYTLGYYSIFKYLMARTSTMLCELTNALNIKSTALPLCVKMRPYFFPSKEIPNDDDITEKETYDNVTDYVELFVNSSAVRQILGVPNRNFIMCNSEVEHDFYVDFLVSQDQTIGEVLNQGVKVMLYVGMYDAGSHWIGVEQVAKGVVWQGQSDFNKATPEEWTVEGEKIGERRHSGLFSFTKVYGTGHLSPLKQPAHCFKMLEQFVFAM